MTKETKHCTLLRFFLIKNKRGKLILLYVQYNNLINLMMQCLESPVQTKIGNFQFVDKQITDFL